MLTKDLADQAEEDKQLPRCYSKWRHLSCKIFGDILAALELPQLDTITLASISKSSDRLHLILYALKLSEEARLPRDARTISAVCAAAAERYRAVGSVLDECRGLAAAPMFLVLCQPAVPGTWPQFLQTPLCCLQTSGA